MLGYDRNGYLRENRGDRSSACHEKQRCFPKVKIRELELSTLWVQSRRGEEVWVLGSHTGRCGFLFIYLFISETESNDLHQAGPEIRDPSASDFHMLTHGHTRVFRRPQKLESRVMWTGVGKEGMCLF